MTICEEKPIPVHYDTKLVEIKEDRIICETPDGSKVEYECDTVLLAMGMKSRTEKAEELRHSAPETSCHIVGDVRKVGTICDAVNEAFRACLHV